MIRLLAIMMFAAMFGCAGGFTCEGECGQDGDVSPDTEQDFAGDTDEEDLREDDGEEAGDAPEVTGDAAGDPLRDEDAPEDILEEEEIAPPPPVYSFVVYGDNQFATSSCTSGVSERMAIPGAILELDPAFILHTGDLMDHGYDDGAYDAFVDCYSGMLAAIPFFPTMGNHDAGSGGVWNYKDYVEQQLFTDNPAAYGAAYDADFETWYEDDPTEYSTDFDHPTHRDILPSGVCFKTNFAYKYANAYFISFEQGTRWWTNTPTTWVETHLEQARSDPSIRHVFVHMHHPMYSTTMQETHDGECIEPVRRHYEDMFRLYDVTVVFSGHAHVYDRFYVPDDESASRARPPPTEYPHDGEAVHYIVTGGGGGPLPNGCSPPPGEKEQYSYDYSQQRGCGYHVTLVEVDGDALQLSIIGVEGSAGDFTTSVWDTFAIQ